MMSQINLYSGILLRIEGRVLRYERRDKLGRCVFVDMGTEAPQVFKEDELLRLTYERKAYRISGSEELAISESRVSKKPNLDTLIVDAALRARTCRRIEYVQAWDRSGEPTCTRDVLASIILTTAERIRDALPPRPGTVQGWIAQWLESGKDPLSLIDGIRNRGVRGPKGETRPEREVQRIVEELYLSAEAHNPVLVRDTIDAYFQRHNEVTGSTWKVPSLSTVRRRLAKLNRYDVMAAREGVAAADRKFQPTGLGAETTRPLERVELDLLKTDIIVVDEDKNPIDRPVIVLAIDHYSRMPLGFSIGFDQSVAAVMACIRNCIYPKTYIKDEFPDLNGTWPAWGLGENYVVDLGSQLLSDSFIQMMVMLRSNVIYAPLLSPNEKAVVERFFGTVTRDLIEHLPGRTFADFYKRGKEKVPEMQPVVTIEELRYLVHRWVVEYYIKKSHITLGCSPLEKWEEGIRKYPIAPLPNPDFISNALSLTAYRRLHDYGIEYKKILYNGVIVGEIRADPAFNDRGAATIKIDPTDLGSIQVYHPGKQAFFRLEQTLGSRRTFDARGVAVWQQDMALKLMDARKNHYKESGLARAHADLHAYVRENLVIKDRTVRRAKALYRSGKFQPGEPPVVDAIESQLAISAVFHDVELENDIGASFDDAEEGGLPLAPPTPAGKTTKRRKRPLKAIEAPVIQTPQVQLPPPQISPVSVDKAEAIRARMAAAGITARGGNVKEP
ncbi:transposase [Nitrospirillum viridazoti Y2]|uniref:Integrase-like protein n=1 Tax=Nitrospirillum amazonense TaxID=28077 RepID=A0A560IH76_9PROT|nr:DDE-type integrase/transposase/recombinase [Nitrospirillum amazonense]EGY02504.1 transposase [Nitrospirillum amazonense Y2]TWB56150.1 integrase-like protein [Nitrospirillum amazonense]